MRESAMSGTQIAAPVQAHRHPNSTARPIRNVAAALT
jgi:hypothetical protein